MKRAILASLLVASPLLAQSAETRTSVAGSLDLKEQSSAPAVRTNYGRLYTKISDGHVYYKDDAGNEYDLTTGVSGDGYCLVDGTRVFTGNVSFEGATVDDFETTFAITDPTADNTITFKNASGTVAFTSDITNMSAADILAALITVDGAGSGLDADLLDGVNEAALCLIDGTRSFTGNITTSGDINVNGDDVTCDSTTCSLFNATATTINIGAAAITIEFNGGSASTGCTLSNGNLTCANLTVSGAVNAQGVYRNDQSAHLEIDETSIRGTAALQITTQNNGDVTLAPSGSGDVVLTPGSVGRVELNTTTVTSLASTLCDADAEVGHMYRVSANAAADIALCVCGKAASAYSFFPLVSGGDCTP